MIDFFCFILNIKQESCEFKLENVFDQHRAGNFVITHLFNKLPWPTDSEETFSVLGSSCHLSTTHGEDLTLSVLMLNAKQEAVSIIFYSFWFDPTKNRT